VSSLSVCFIISLQFEAARGEQVTISVFTTDLAGNRASSPFSWTFGVQEPECGRAEFYGINTTINSALVFNSSTLLVDGAAKITAYNPNHKELSWVHNTRIETIDLLYRKSGFNDWLPALDMNGNPAAFYDDVRICHETFSGLGHVNS
jgi:hypothetical protein